MVSKRRKYGTKNIDADSSTSRVASNLKAQWNGFAGSVAAAVKGPTFAYAG